MDADLLTTLVPLIIGTALVPVPLVLTVLLLGSAQIARGASILAVRLWPAPDYSRVTIESDGLLASRQTPPPGSQLRPGPPPGRAP